MSRRGSFIVILLDPILSSLSCSSFQTMSSSTPLWVRARDAFLWAAVTAVSTKSDIKFVHLALPSLLQIIHTHPKDQGWFSRPSKINHSRSRVSYLVPSAVQALVGLRETESILEMAVDAPRRVLIVRCTETLKVGVLLFQSHLIHPFLFFSIRFYHFCLPLC